jgi:hypothetical protein
VNTPGCGACGVLDADASVTLSVVSGTSGIVVLTPTTTTILAGQVTSPNLSIGTPTATGTYQIQATATGFGVSISGAVTVNP